jgi:hypothetical protein
MPNAPARVDRRADPGRSRPLSHGIDAARQLAGGATIEHVAGALTKELVIGAVYLSAGLLLLRSFERQGRVSGTLDRFSRTLAARSGTRGNWWARLAPVGVEPSGSDPRRSHEALLGSPWRRTSRRTTASL